ncbi:glutaredoxin [Nitzschia inconspicua]|uniref:Glutaredoxin n=1 Tax=Nitzschia inconspicua TaxID=303405 RepID=A0A9K3PKU6_9STRA|nr:glutaredoxin [Nitzschia inconspicua]
MNFKQYSSWTRSFVLMAVGLAGCRFRVVDAFQYRTTRFHSFCDSFTDSTRLHGMKRPLLDTLASTLFKLEQSRVEASSEVDEQGRVGEPMEWSESSSWANKFSELVASNSLGYQFKQFVADIVAGDYDEEAVRSKVEAFISGSVDDDSTRQQQQQTARVAMFSFTTCPFCRRAKDYLDERGIPYSAMELDELEGNEGNQIRAVLGKMTQRTSVPSIFVGGTYIGGCNDGPGLLPLAESGKLETLLLSKK